jgi:hypothetical protein
MLLSLEAGGYLAFTSTVPRSTPPLQDFLCDVGIRSSNMGKCLQCDHGVATQL